MRLVWGGSLITSWCYIVWRQIQVYAFCGYNFFFVIASASTLNTWKKTCTFTSASQRTSSNEVIDREERVSYRLHTIWFSFCCCTVHWQWLAHHCHQTHAFKLNFYKEGFFPQAAKTSYFFFVNLVCRRQKWTLNKNKWVRVSSQLSFEINKKKTDTRNAEISLS